MSFTAGPWQVESKAMGGHLVSTVSEPLHEIALVYTNAHGLENAHLMASAPELLDCLDEVVDWLSRNRVYEHYDISALVNMIEAAVAKSAGVDVNAARREMSESMRLIQEHDL